MRPVCHATAALCVVGLGLDGTQRPCLGRPALHRHLRSGGMQKDGEEAVGISIGSRVRVDTAVANAQGTPFTPQESDLLHPADEHT